MKKTKLLKALLIAFLILPCVLVFTACSLTPVQSINGRDGINGLTPHIGPNGNWWLGTEDLGILAVGRNGTNGLTPYVGENLMWWIGEHDTGILAFGRDGNPGATPFIGEDGYWWIGEQQTGFYAIGRTPYVNEGNWWIDGVDTGYAAIGKDAPSPHILDGYWWIGDHNTGFRAVGIDGKNGNDGITPHIGVDGCWWIGEFNTGHNAIAQTPYIVDGTWWIGDYDTGFVAIGLDAPVPHIHEGNWWIGEVDTGFAAIGKDGSDGKDGITPRIGANGNWWLDDYDTGWTAVGQHGTNGENGKDGTDGLTPFIKDGTWWIGDFDTGVIASVDLLVAEYQALLNYLIELNKTIAYLQSLFTPAPVSFDVDSWQTIANVSASGFAHNVYNVGDEKTFMLKDGEVITVIILGFNHDDLTSGLGKAGITLGMKNLMATTASMNTVAGNGWHDSEMRNVTLVDIFDKLPDALQAIIKTVNKTSTVGDGTISDPNLNTVITADKLWLLSRVEIDGNMLDGFEDEGTQYEYWTDKDANADRIKRLTNGTGSATAWWLRSSTTTSATAFNAINPNGAFNVGASSTSSQGISFGFCI